MKIVILYGQIAENAGKDEQDTLVQVDTVSQVLRDLGHAPVAVPLSLNIVEAVSNLQGCKPDFVFNLVESIHSHGCLIHLAPALLDALELRYTGAGTEAMLLTSNKLLAKRYLQGSGLPTPQWFSSEDLKDNTPIAQGMYILKSVWEHASVGLFENPVIRSGARSELYQALENRLDQLGGEGFVEAYIDGREFNLSLLAGNGEPEVLPPAEICFDTYPEEKLKIVDYHAKWDEDSFEYNHTPRRFEFPDKDRVLLKYLTTLAKACWKLFCLQGYARVDFRVDHSGNPWILEVNANPCLSPDAGFMAAAAQAGLTMEQVIEKIMKDI